MEPRFQPEPDAGCEVSRDCLHCPLSRCRHDDPHWYALHRRRARDYRIVDDIRSRRLTVPGAAKEHSITIRSIFRIIQRCNQESGKISEADARVFARLYEARSS